MGSRVSILVLFLLGANLSIAAAVDYIATGDFAGNVSSPGIVGYQSVSSGLVTVYTPVVAAPAEPPGDFARRPRQVQMHNAGVAAVQRRRQRRRQRRGSQRQRTGAAMHLYAMPLLACRAARRTRAQHLRVDAALDEEPRQ